MTTLLDLLAQTGRATWDPLWVPILAWTVLALPLWGLLTRLDRLHPYAEYRLLQVLLAVLPVGVLATSIFDGGMATSPGFPDAGLAITVLPPVETTVHSGSVSAFGWNHALGLVTVAAIVVGLVELGRLVLNGIAAARIRGQAGDTSLPEPARAVVNRLTIALGVNRPVRVCVHPDVVVPATIGGPRPLVLLPPSLADRPDALRMTLAHELVHIRRYDDCAHLAERFVAALFAVHPLVHTLTTRIAEARERACDAAVLADKDTSAGAYARLLAAFADESPRRLGALSLSESPSSLPNRLRAMRSSISHWVSSPFSLITSLLTVGLVLTLGIVACSDSVAPSAQEETAAPEPTAESSTSDEVYVEVEERPDCGGIQALTDEIQYPELARKAGIEGRVFVQFIVDEEGAVTEPTISKGVHELLDEAALAAVKALDCEPGKVRGEAVKTKMALPVTFQLPSDSSSTSASRTDQNENGPSVGLDQIVFPKLSPEQQEQIGSGPLFTQAARRSLHQGISYPDLVQRAGIDGTVEVSFTLDESGSARNARVTQSVHEALDARALQSVETTTFSLVNGQDIDLSGETMKVRFTARHPANSS